MRTRTILAAAGALAAIGALGLATPAIAAEPKVNPHASCVGLTFVPQAVGEPGAIAHRIAEIKGFIDIPFGVVIGDFARWDQSEC
ncbi:hypothetical protein [Agromyces binzhouensis]|uniref:Uncharacterized protein n=1 Tax=Agromyces binzhouensis TaxID=1817495 RepID=A0A4Q2JGN1_9MICO|nr:hypothetical protein [Agromyces binzhouensis]RXZ45180.1 hypothetical protein ESO86_14170 [Agromyces binzhouensis]